MTPHDTIWAAVDGLLDVAASPTDLRAHGLHLLAVRHWREQGLPVPAELVQAERLASFVALGAPAVLAEARSAYDGPMLVLKGPELAARYPEPALRPYGDLDLLVDDAERAHAALVDAGFVPMGPPSPDDFHHLQPLHSARFPMRVEIHTRPSWYDGAEPPRFAELLASARPAALGVDGVLAPAPAHHALLIAAHAWTHEPLGRISHLLDTALLAAECDRADLDDLAARWNATRLWGTTFAVVDALLLGRGELPPGLRLATRKLARVEERSVLESHLWRGLAPFWALPKRDAVRVTTSTFAEAVRPAPGEAWSSKARRSVVTLKHMFMRRSDHEREIGYRP